MLVRCQKHNVIESHRKVCTICGQDDCRHTDAGQLRGLLCDSDIRALVNRYHTKRQPILKPARTISVELTDRDYASFQTWQAHQKRVLASVKFADEKVAPMTRDDSTTVPDDSYHSTYMLGGKDWEKTGKREKKPKKAKRGLYVFDDKGCKMLPPPKWNDC